MLDAAEVGPPWHLHQQRRPLAGGRRRSRDCAADRTGRKAVSPSVVGNSTLSDLRQVVGEVQIGAIENAGRLASAPYAGRSRDRAATMPAGWSGAPARNTTRSPSARTEPNSVNGVSSGRKALRRRDPARPDARAPPAYRRRRSAPAAAKRIGRHRRRPIAARRTPPPSAPAPGWFAPPVEAVEIPPAGAVGHECEPRAVGRPFRLEDRFGRAAGDQSRLARHAVGADVGEAEHACRSTACWGDPTPARRAGCRPATVAATRRNRGRARARARRSRRRRDRRRRWC